MLEPIYKNVLMLVLSSLLVLLWGVWSDNGTINGDFTPTVQDTLEFVYSYEQNCLTLIQWIYCKPLPNINALADFRYVLMTPYKCLLLMFLGVFGPVLALLTQMVISTVYSGNSIHKINYLYIDSNALKQWFCIYYS